MPEAAIRAIEYYLPMATVTNQDLAAAFPDWTAEKIESKTGIRCRRVAAPDELASDMAVAAAEKLFERGVCKPSDIDFLLFCTQSPDYLLPTSACLIQDRLGIPCSAGALDFNLGCSGFVYGLSLAKGIIESGQSTNLLLLTSETYSKHLAPDDFSVRAVFGDAAAATLVTRGQTAPEGIATPWIGPFVFGTDGKGASRLILRRGSLREPGPSDETTQETLYMNGPDIYAFTLKTVPTSVTSLLNKAGLNDSDIDLYVLHQANKYMLENLRLKMRIPPEKFVYALRDVGNTVSSTLPIALRCAADEGKLKPGARVALVGFGVGYSWAAAMLQWGDWDV